jgi:hypothetical protein
MVGNLRIAVATFADADNLGNLNWGDKFCTRNLYALQPNFCGLETDFTVTVWGLVK